MPSYRVGLLQNSHAYMKNRSGPDQQTFVLRADERQSPRHFSPARPFPSSRSQLQDPPVARRGATRINTSLPSLTDPSKPVAIEQDYGWWTKSSRIATICCIPSILDLFGIKGFNVQQAWREKVTLCMIIALIMTFVGYFTVGMRSTMCIETNQGSPYFNGQNYNRPWRDQVMIRGFAYNFNQTRDALRPFVDLTVDWYNEDISPIFKPNLDECRSFVRDEYSFCSVPNKLPLSPPLLTTCVDPAILNKVPAETRLTLEWADVKANDQLPHLLAIYNGQVLNLTRFFNQERNTTFRNLPSLSKLIPGRDVTLGMSHSPETVQLIKCLASRYTIGYLGTESIGCAAYNTLMILALITVVGLILVRFVMAFLFHWTIAPQITRLTSVKLGRNDVGYMRAPTEQYFTARQDGQGPFMQQQWARSLALPTDLYTICLVTCYSEDERGIKNTLDSIAATDYPDERKLLFVICDGLIQGEGNNQTTPDVVIGMIDQDPELGEPEPCSYLAIADGEKQTNMAKVYAGKYMYRNRPVPIVVVVKCGTEKERDAATPQELAKKKAGNRGKRDSQLILINFLSRVTFYDRMTQLDYELFYKIRQIAGITSDLYDLVLMVDADTVVDQSSLKYMVQTMVNDPSVMGLCGETRIANKMESWVTMIQVYEYFTNHNLGKSFESVFGGVTCLPGCFCMYRIKSTRGKDVVPLLVNPDIVEQYSENVVDTLHKKNLLLLGEDRFLSTLMLGTFPKRKMVFVPQALCHTTVPHTYKMLQSQRRRWINSTIHNLLELVLLPNLCGTFCFSMQFVIALELFGTVSLPAAVVLTMYLIVSSAISGSTATLPLVLLVMTLILPGILVLLTTRKPVYALWMFVYLLALPIWNFALPLYSFWHFDDFSWGDTRKVEGEIKGQDHSTRQGAYEIGSVQLKLWEEWEQSRLVEEAKKPKRPITRKPKELPVIEKDVPPSLPARPVPPIPAQYTFREATKDISKSNDTEFLSALQTNDYIEVEKPIRPSFERPQTAFKIEPLPRRFSLPVQEKKMPLETIEQSVIVPKPPTPIEKDSILLTNSAKLNESVVPDSDSNITRSSTQPLTESSRKTELSSSTLPIKAGNTINKFWKTLYLGQQGDISLSQSQVLTSSIAQGSRFPQDSLVHSERRNSLLELPKLDLSLNVGSMLAFDAKSTEPVKEKEIQKISLDEPITASSTMTRGKAMERSETVSTIETPRPSQLQLENATTSVLPEKSFIVTPIVRLDDSFSTNSTPTQSFQTAPYESEDNLSVRSSVQGPRPLPLEMDQSLSRSMASLQSFSLSRQGGDSKKKPIGPRPDPDDANTILNQTLNKSMAMGQSMNISMNRSVVGPRPLPRDSEEKMNQSISKSIHSSMQRRDTTDDSLLSFDDSFDISIIHPSQDSTQESQLKGPRDEPWEVDLSFNLDDNRTSTTNKKFKEIFHRLKKPKS